MKWTETREFKKQEAKRIVVKDKNQNLQIYFYTGADISLITMREQYEYFLEEGSEAKQTDFQIAWELSNTRDKPFFIGEIRGLIRALDNEENSMSKFVEELNIAAVKWHNKQSTASGSEAWVSEQDELATELVKTVINSPTYGSMVENVLNNFTIIKKST